MFGAEKYIVQASTDGTPRLDYALAALAKTIKGTSASAAGHEALQTGGDLPSDASAAVLRRFFSYSCTAGRGRGTPSSGEKHRAGILGQLR
jgi:hypothetical protein